MNEQITYELPLSERIRIFLRLQNLFDQMQYFALHDNEHQNRAELNCLLDILTITSRNDLKNEIIKEVERHTKSLVIFSKNPHVDSTKLKKSIEQLNDLNLSLMSSNIRTENKLNQVELLKSLAQRSSIPGGSCDFDLPIFHFWLHRPLAERRKEIQRWTTKKGFTIIAHKKSKSGRTGYFYFRVGEDPGSESQKIQGYFAQLPELNKFAFKAPRSKAPRRRPSRKF